MKQDGQDSLDVKMQSPLTEGRGLKLSHLDTDDNGRQVAPHGGAWIETIFQKVYQGHAIESPLTEGRGLKLST